MNKKISPSFLILIALLMAPLRVGAMESFFDIKKEESNRHSASAAAVRAHERAATELNEEQDDLPQDHQLYQEALDHVTRLIKANRTMVCLKALDSRAVSSSTIAAAFMTANQGVNFDDIPLILNNGEQPVSIIIRHSEDQSNDTTVIPTIIPAGTKTIANDITTTAPTRVPTAEENKQVRQLVKEAYQCYYEYSVRDLFSNFDQKDTPIMASEIRDIFVKIEEDRERVARGGLQLRPIQMTSASANEDYDLEYPLILNNGNPPMSTRVSASEDQSNDKTIILLIISSGIKTIGNGTPETIVMREPTPEENRQVRKLAKKGIQVGLGFQARKLLLNFVNNTPLNSSEIEKIAEQSQEIMKQNETVIVEDAQTLLLLGDLPEYLALNKIDGVKWQKMKGFLGRAEESLTSPNKALYQAVLYAGESVGRGAGVIGGTITGFSSKLVRGAVTGVVSVGAGPCVGGANQPMLGSLLAAPHVGGFFDLNPTEATRSLVGSYVLMFASLPLLGSPHPIFMIASAAALGGALPFTLDFVPAAQRALSDYAPGVALEKAKEAFYGWSNPTEKNELQLKLMQQDQGRDQSAMATLRDFPEDFFDFAVEETRSEEGITTPETLTPQRIPEILSNEIKWRMHDRKNWMTRLQEIIDAIQEKAQQKEKQSRATFQSSDFRTRYPRGL